MVLYGTRNHKDIIYLLLKSYKYNDFVFMPKKSQKVYELIDLADNALALLNYHESVGREVFKPFL